LAVGKSPEEWVGRMVLVEVAGGVEYQMVTRLEGIDERGVVVKDAGTLRPGEGPEEAADVFFPWGRILAMRPASEADLETPPGY
jgi:hypothetical protein